MVSREWTKFAMLAIPCLIVSGLSVGCVGRFNGGGSIDSVAGAPERATFGFVINVVDLPEDGLISDHTDADGVPDAVTGQFQFNDHGTGVRFHVDQFEPAGYALIPGSIFNPEAVIFAYHGTYTCSAGTGELDLGVASDDQIEPFSGAPNTDALFVSVATGPYAGYFNMGLIQNGNIHFRPPQ